MYVYVATYVRTPRGDVYVHVCMISITIACRVYMCMRELCAWAFARGHIACTCANMHTFSCYCRKRDRLHVVACNGDWPIERVPLIDTGMSCAAKGLVISDDISCM